MCGIFGIAASKSAGFKPAVFKSSVNRLFKLSESRGKEASGLAILSDDRIFVYKNDVPARTLTRCKIYNRLFAQVSHRPVLAVGHSRLVTDGSQESYENNQPVIKNGLVAVHNGIVANVNALWKQYPDLERRFEVDTEIILGLVGKFYKETGSIRTAFQKMYDRIEGAAAVAVLFHNLDRMVLATNNGSLYIARDNTGKNFVFASEEYILETFLRKCKPFKQDDTCEILPVFAGTGYIVNTRDFSMEPFQSAPGENCDPSPAHREKSREIIELREEGRKIARYGDSAVNRPLVVPSEFHDDFLTFESSIKSLKRCTRCVLPETLPFIEFDENGVCNVCGNYRRHRLKGEDALRDAVEKYRGNPGRPNCIMAFSGGRDSSYGLHYVKNILEMNPVSYTYDWGMVTNLARRNISRMCARLGIENIVISADISKKRRYIRKNVTAWLKKPEIGMIPLFMAGDKHFFYYANQLKKRTRIPLDIWCFNVHEKADFKEEFSGIKMWDPQNKKDSDAKVATELRWSKSFLLGLYYTKHFFKNPRYLNSSLPDTFTGYISYYFLEKDLLSLYDYIPWNEKHIEETLIKEYNWETSPDTRTTWRIGDGTASFYNYIYYTAAGFTENDWFRSNQVREGMLTREKAEELIYEENKPRWESIKWYCDTIGIDYLEVIRVINSMSKLYRIA